MLEKFSWVIFKLRSLLAVKVLLVVCYLLFTVVDLFMELWWSLENMRETCDRGAVSAG